MVLSSPQRASTFENKDFKRLLDLAYTVLTSLSKPAQIVSFTFVIPTIRPLNILGGLDLKTQDYFYWQRSQSQTALLAVGRQLELSFSGPNRFQQVQQALTHYRQRIATIDSRATGSESSLEPHSQPHSKAHLEPHFVCSFGFFAHAQVAVEATTALPTETATLYLPEWCVMQQEAQTTLTLNLDWSSDGSIEQLCCKAWQHYNRVLRRLPQAAYEFSARELERQQRSTLTLQTTEVGDRQQFRTAIEAVLAQIEQEQLHKVVLARALDVKAPQPLSVPNCLQNLQAQYPACDVFALSNGQGETFIGASPERLLSISAGVLATEALAGSAPRGRSPQEDIELAHALLTNPKELYEHQLVAQFICRQLDALGLVPQRLPKPCLRRLANIQHLQTPIQAQLPEQIHPLEVLAQLHPTPAVAGVPRQRACELIQTHEAFERSQYAAPLGWIDAAQNCEFTVGIRSALLRGDRARLFAGAGIVKGSQPDHELQEIDLKLRALLQALV